MKDEFTKFLGARLKEFRKHKGFTQEKFAELLEIDPKHLSRIECGKTQPSLNLIRNIAKILNVKVHEIFDENKTNIKEKLIQDITLVLEKSNEEELKLFYKIILNIKN